MVTIKLEHIDYYFQDGTRRRQVLKDVNALFENGKFYSIEGKSGSGKSTLLSIIGGLDMPKSGSVLFRSTDISKYLREYRKSNCSTIFQTYNLIPYLTTVENIKLSTSISKKKIEIDTIYNLLDYVGISNKTANKYVRMLSGGEKQRVAIARAIALDTDIILADEPTGNLDEENEKIIMEIFKDLAHKYNKCVIVVTHSKEFSQQSDQTLYLKRGKLTEVE